MFADKTQQENSYEAQREDIMVDGEITTTVVSLSEGMLCFSIDGTGETFGESGLFQQPSADIYNCGGVMEKRRHLRIAIKTFRSALTMEPDISRVWFLMFPGLAYV